MRATEAGSRRFSLLALAPALALGALIVPIVCGLAATVLPAFGHFPALGASGPGLDPWRELWATPGLGQSVWLSLSTGLVTTALSLAAVALFTAAWSGTRAFRITMRLLSPLLALPHAAAAFALAFLIAPTGMLARLASPWATGWTRPPDLLILNDPAGLSLMGGLVVKEIPFLMLVTLAALQQSRAVEARRLAASFGYGRVRGFLTTVWPGLYRQIRLPVFAVLAYATSVVDVAIVLGPATPPTLAVRLTQWMADPDLTLRLKASAGALLQLGVTLLALGLWVALERVGRWLLHRTIETGRRGLRDGWARGVALAAGLLPTVAIGLGLTTLALWSVSGFWRFPAVVPPTLSIAPWERTLAGLTGPIGTTLAIALVSAAVALVLVLGCLEREARTGRTGGERALWLLYLPLVMPQVVFVFGLQLFFLWLGIDATLGALVLAHLVFVLPYVFLSLSDPWRAFDGRLVHMARALGHGADGVFWRVRLPMLARAVLAAAAIGVAVSVGQYLPTLLVGAGRFPTVTTEAVALAAGGDRRVLAVTALVQALLPFLAFAFAALVPAIAFRNRRAMKAAG